MAHALKIAPFLLSLPAKIPVRGDRVPVEAMKLVFRRTRASKVEQKLTGMEQLYDMAGWTKVQEGPDPYMGWPQDWAQSHLAINHYLGT